ncbi:uncharacterized protein LOC132720832 [Ruditapes philippinarum]|uniref:uncharacterized protein LOC132720832 n=1 Tax=Ruditapes philippinarum TaxID=129788 RepID=UPI00295BD5DA|nr:uncharacterized protein LOC132720832 [Ruditapes philippinarum]
MGRKFWIWTNSLEQRNVTQNPIGTGKQCPDLVENRYIDITPTVIETAKNVEQYFIRPKYNPNINPGERRLLVRRQTNQGNVRDLLLIMDSSGSIGWSNFRKANKEISTLIGLLCPENPFEKVNGQYQYNQAAMLTFSTTVHQHFDFDDHATTEDIQGAISKAMYYGGGTNTAEAFIQAIGMFKSSKGEYS